MVLDNFSIFKPAALYETFPPVEARRILKKLQFHFTPTHGSWLHTAEIEWNVYGRAMKTYGHHLILRTLTLYLWAQISAWSSKPFG